MVEATPFGCSVDSKAVDLGNKRMDKEWVYGHSREHRPLVEGGKRSDFAK